MDDQQRARESQSSCLQEMLQYMRKRGWIGADIESLILTHAAMDAAALRAAPEGFVLVPVEPTEEMVDASLISVPIAKRINPGQHLRIYGARAWAAMLAARPQGVKDAR